MKRGAVIGLGVAVGCLGLGVVALAVGGAAAWWMYGRVKGGDIDEVAQYLPADTPMLIGFRGFADLAIEFGSAFTAPSNDPAVTKFKDKFSKEGNESLGFDPLDAKGWQATGLDFTRPWAVASQGDVDPSKADFLVFVPVTDGDAAMATFRGYLDRNKVTVKDQKVGDYSFLLIEDAAAATIYNDFLVVAGAEHSGYDPVTSLRVFVERDGTESLAKVQDWKDVKSSLGDTWHLFGFVSGATIQAGMAEMSRELGNADWAKIGSHGAGYIAHFANDKITAKAAVLNDPGTPLAGSRATGEDTLAPYIDGEPVLAMRLSADIPSLWAEAKKTPQTQRDLEETTRELREQWGVDLEADVVNNLTGDATILVTALDNAPIPVAVTVYAGVKDATKAQNLLDLTSKKLTEQGLPLSTDATDDQHWYFNDKGGVGLAREHILATFGDGRREALKASLKGGGASFLTKVPADVSANLQHGAATYAWLDLARSKVLLDKAGKALGPLGGGRGAMDSATALFSGMSFSAGTQSNAVVVETVAYAVPGGFTGAIEAQAAKMEVQANRAEVPGNVDGIKTAELAYDAAFDTYLACGSEAQARAAVTVEPHDWVTDACWTQLGWRPDGAVRGGYWTTVDSWGTRFEVHGVIDVDGDGNLAEYTASSWRNADLVTSDEVY